MPISYSPSLTASVAASPTPAITTSSPHTTFRSLRSLLPFGPNKNANTSQSSSSSSPQANASRNAFSGFGSVRKSLTRERERKTSLTNLLPVISIDRPPADQSFEDGHIRRASSFSNIESPTSLADPDRQLPNEFGTLGRHSISEAAPVLRSISPCPPFDQQSSKSPIVEVLQRDSPPPSITASEPQRGSEMEASLDLSRNQIAKEVYEAIVERNVVAAEEWLNVEQPVVIDADTNGDILSTQIRADNASINIENVDPSIVTLLIPNNFLPKKGNLVINRPQIGSLAASAAEPNPLSSNSLLSQNDRSQPRRTTPTSSSIPRLRSMVHEPTTPGATCADTTFKASVTPISSIQRVRSNVTRRSTAPSPSLSNTSVPETRIPMNTGSAPAALRHRSYGHSPSMSLSVSSVPSTPSLIVYNHGITPRIPSYSGRLQANSASETHLKTSKSTTPSPTTTPRHRPQVLQTPEAGSSTTSSSALISTAPNTPKTSSSVIRHAPSISRQDSGSSSILRRQHEFYDDTTSYGRASLDSGRSQIPAAGSDSHILVTSTPFKRSLDGTAARPRSLSSETAMSPTSIRSHPQSREGYLGANIASRSDMGDTVSPSSLAISGREDCSLSPSPRAVSSLRPAFGVPFRSRKRSMSVQESARVVHGVLGKRPDGILQHHRLNGGSRSNTSLSGRLTNGRERDIREEVDELRKAPQHDWLGPRSMKALRAAGLLSDDRERDRDGDREQDKQLVRSPRERSGSVATSVMSGGSGRTSLGGLGRFVPSVARSNASEYGLQNGRAQSRMAFSDAGAGAGGGPSAVSITTSRRRGSETFSYPYLMHSPTLTTSTSGSRDRESRDTPRSASTAPTSVSSTSLAHMSRERDRDRERERERERDEIRELKEKHSTETGALLGALSDSQRTTRLLREENADLRERLGRVRDLEAENEELRHEVRGLRRETSELKIRLLAGNVGRGGRNGWLGTGSTGRRSGLSTPVEGRQGSPLQPSLDQQNETDDMEVILSKDALRASTWNRCQESLSEPVDTPASPEALQHHRRSPSDASSIFPVLPSNMSMLMHEDNALLNDQGSNTGGSPANDNTLEQARPTGTKPVSFRKPGGQNGMTTGAANRSSLRMSMTSTASISPTTANLSIMTGSPGSLFLRPEHEVHLGDMETFSLDFGAGRPDDLGDPNDW
ncbi:hypothetical protein AX15_002368 [Amanita polypyramis BW_CC]|nr:hypothetical protein AX15_002368 [Amanita polypyramis BW_CC]